MTETDSYSAADERSSDRHQFVDFRTNLVRLGLLLSWTGIAVLALGGHLTYGLDDSRVWIPVSLLATLLVVLTFLPWSRLLEHPLSDALLVVWASAGVIGMVAGQEFRTEPPIVVLFALVVVFSAAQLLGPFYLTAISMVAVGGYLLASMADETMLTSGELALRTGALAAACLATIVLGRGLSRLLVGAAARLRQLEEREAELKLEEAQLEQMYAVSRTIGAGSNLSEVLPELVGRVVDVVGAKIGLVLLYRRDEQALEVMSPIWVAGHTLRAEGYLLLLTEKGIAQQVYISGEPAMSNDLAESGIRDTLLSDLDAESVAAVPLQVESRQIGVLLVADKEENEFHPRDLDTLTSLAAPSALVLNQMSRYEAVQEAGAKAAELAQLKTDFVSVVSHELRTPLTSIIGSLKTLARPELAPTHPNALELLATAEKQADRLRVLIEDLLVVSRLDNQALPVRSQHIDARPFLTDVVHSIPEAAHRVVVDVAPDLDEFESDPEHLRRILTNLITNALKYSGPGTIELSALTSGSEVWLAVIDHGPGIPYELHDHVFDRFTQVDHAETRVQGGTGLGLSIVRGLTEAMGGRVWFEPTLGGGATFTVALTRRAQMYQRQAQVTGV